MLVSSFGDAGHAEKWYKHHWICILGDKNVKNIVLQAYKMHVPLNERNAKKEMCFHDQNDKKEKHGERCVL